MIHVVSYSFLFLGAKLGDGIPELRQNLTLSPPSVPSVKEHAPCHREVKVLPYLAEVTPEVFNATNSLWRASIRSADEEKFLSYSSEDDIVFWVRLFLTDILLALDLRLNFSAEVTIKQIRPDLCVLLLDMYLVGVVEVKKPGCNVLLEPTVLGELLDQMLLVEGFYGMGPVIGILTTAEEWIVSWFPVDSCALEHSNVERSETSFSTPLKATSVTNTESTVVNRQSPPGGTPSQKSGKVHTIEIDADDPVSLGDNDNCELSEEMERVLCTTEVVSIRSEPKRVIQLLCSAFQLMARSRTHHRANLSRCLLKFHKGIHAVTFHPVSYGDIHSMVNFDKFPSKNVKTLVALEDLGRGSTGKAWLCVTITKPRSAVCVLKFDNKHANSNNLVNEMNMWNLLYPELSHMIKLEHWSGADALVMPHFSTVLEQEREDYKEELREVLTAKFAEKRKVHRDVRWRNIGKYRSKGEKAVIVVFDLHDVVDYDEGAHNDWIEKAITSLYVDY